MSEENGNGWELRSLSDPKVCILNPKKSEIRNTPDDTEVTFVPMAQVDDDTGAMDVSLTRKFGEVKKGYTYFREHDVVFAKITPCMENGKSAVARGLKNGIGFGTTEFHVLRAGPMVIPEWIQFYVRRKDIREEAQKSMCGAAGQQRVPIDFLRELEIPVPPLDEQRRIVSRIEALTRRADEARRLRQAAIDEADMLLNSLRKSLYQQLLDQCPHTPLGECGSVLGGGTPSKSDEGYWGGDTPWVTAKEMWAFDVTDTDLKITQRAVRETTVKVVPLGSVLFVVRGSILFKRVPVAVNRVSCTINQDMKAIVPIPELNGDFLAHMLWGANDELKRMVDTAGNSAGKLPTKNWESIAVPMPPLDEQKRIVARLDAIRAKLDELERVQREAEAELTAFTSALLAKAFRGEP